MVPYSNQVSDADLKQMQIGTRISTSSGYSSSSGRESVPVMDVVLDPDGVPVPNTAPTQTRLELGYESRPRFGPCPTKQPDLFGTA